jgi:(p)ppGpp synthase/HD superfamily hydrolase
MDKLLELALNLATEAHRGQVDKGGHPYINHVTRVSNNCSDLDSKIVGMIHDIVEDTYYTLNDLSELGFPDYIVQAIDAISKRKGESYNNYISRVKSNNIAIKVKLSDLKDNTDLSRLSSIYIKDLKRWIKYNKLRRELEGLV